MTDNPCNTEALWTAIDAAAATGGRARGGIWNATGVSIDSRSVSQGDLFVALVGPTHDAHDHVTQALENGAAAAVVSTVPARLADTAPLLIVDDTTAALEALGHAARDRSSARVVAITGSVGKTGTKELTAAALAATGPTTATIGNLNNHFGVPLSLARLTASAVFAVLEAGMSAPGEIATLARQIRPHVAVVTTVEAVHTEFFDSLEGVADAKGEIFQGLEPNGTAIINRDNLFFYRLVALAEEAGASRIISFGTCPKADVRLLDCAIDAAGSALTVSLHGTEMTYRIKLNGQHWALNSLAALAAATAAGADPARAIEGLAAVAPMKGRGEQLRVAFADGQLDLIDETYNASPASVSAALQALGTCTPGAGGRRIAVLGDMLELGPEADRWHADLAAGADAADIDLVCTAGPLMAHLHVALPTSRRGIHAQCAEKLIAPLLDILTPGDVVLIKGSLGSRMEQIIEALTHTPTTGVRAANGE